MITNDECLKNFFEDYSMRLKIETLDDYLYAVRKLQSHCDKPFAAITSRDIRSWMNALETRYKPSTVSNMLAGVKLFYRYCSEEELITKNPVELVPYPKKEEKIPHYLQIDQLEELRKLVKGRRKERAIIEVLYATGVRISEMAAFKKDDIVWSERIMHVREGKGKKDRIVLFTRLCEEHLLAYLQERQDDLPFLFVNVAGTGPVSISSTDKKFVTYTKKLGIRITPHTLRHTFAAHLAIKGMPLAGIQSLLGHVEPKHTQLYARLISHAQKQMYDGWM